MHEKRYVRFASITGIDVPDLPIACEIWLEDVSNSSWSSLNILKLANLFVRYMCHSDPGMLTMRAVEQRYGLDKSQVKDIMRLMVIYGAAESFDSDAGYVRASLRLTYLQRLRVLEVKSRFNSLHSAATQPRLPWHKPEEKWMLKNTLPEVANQLEERDSTSCSAPVPQPTNA